MEASLPHAHDNAELSCLTIGQKAQESRRISAAERAALALREIGPIEPTLHALDWLERPQLRP